MKLENQVVSLELAKRLKELGVKQESLFKWFISPEGWKVVLKEEGTGKLICPSAYSVAELGEMLPPSIILDEKEKHLQFAKMKNGFHRVAYYSLYSYAPKKAYFSESTEADARAAMLIYLLENNLINSA